MEFIQAITSILSYFRAWGVWRIKKLCAAGIKPVMKFCQCCVACNIFMICILFAGAAQAASPDEKTEVWQGTVLGAKFITGVCFAPNGSARAVLLLTHRNGQTDVYHLYGQLVDNAFELRHGSGHIFRGKLTSAGKMEGRVRLSGGIAMPLSGTRTPNVQLAEDCAPLAK